MFLREFVRVAGDGWSTINGDTARGRRQAHGEASSAALPPASWYLVCRPARPSPPVELEQLITTVTPVTDITLVGRELTELRELEGELDYENLRGEVYAHAMELLEQQLRAAAKDAAKDAGEARSWGAYVAGADDGWRSDPAPLGPCCRPSSTASPGRRSRCCRPTWIEPAPGSCTLPRGTSTPPEG